MADWWDDFKRAGKLGTGQQAYQWAEDMKNVRAKYPKDIVYGPNVQKKMAAAKPQAAPVQPSPPEPTPEEQGYKTYKRTPKPDPFPFDDEE